MTMPMQLGGNPGQKAAAWQWWEGEPDRMQEIREKVARLIVKKSK